MLKDLLGARKNVKGMMKGAWKDKEAMAKWVSGDRNYDNELADLELKAKDAALNADDKSKYEWMLKFKNKINEEELGRLRLLYAVLDGRQLALKVVCNSVYGFLKAFILTDKDLMSSVTSWGRWMIMKTKEVVEKYYNKMRVEVDRVKCAELGISPEWEPDKDQTEEDDPRPWRGAYVVYGDTDSVMVNFGDISLDECMRLGEECSEIATKTFVSPNLLEFESVKIRSLFLNKKRYAALELEGYKYGEGYESACKRAKLNCKGLESKRRDNAKIGSQTQKKVLDYVLRHGDVPAAEEYVKKVLRDILMDRVDMSQYVITKGLSKTEEQYAKSGTKQQHVELGKKQRARGEESAQTGDRVPFVMITGYKNSKAYQRVEDPIYAQKHGVPIDKEYYINKQVMSACLRVFTGIWAPHQCKDIVSGMKLRTAQAKLPKMTVEEKLRYHQIYSDSLNGFENSKTMEELEDNDAGKVYLDDLVAYKRLFAYNLPHMRQKKDDRARTYAIGKHTRKRNRCMGCGIPMPPEFNKSPVCFKCLDKEQSIKEKTESELKRRKKTADDAWDQCRTCQGLPEDAELLECSNLICDNFFHRNRVLQDMEDIGLEFDRFKTTERPKKRKKQVVKIFKGRQRKKKKSNEPSISEKEKDGKGKKRKKTIESFFKRKK